MAAAWRPLTAVAQSDVEAAPESHGMSAFGDLKYPADFSRFDYVNAEAPKGGVFSTVPSSRAYNQSFHTFNSLNSFVLKGDGAVGMDQTFAALMVRSRRPLGANFAGQADVPVYTAAGSALP